MPAQVGDNVDVDHPTWARLEDQIGWYEEKSIEAQRTYRRIKITEIVFAASIPFLAGFQDNLGALLGSGLSLVPAVLIAALGVAVVILEGLTHINQYHRSWLGHRTTCEALKQEKFLFLAGAGPYADVDDKLLHLAERVESLLSQDRGRWASLRERSRETRRAAA